MEPNTLYEEKTFIKDGKMMKVLVGKDSGVMDIYVVPFQLFHPNTGPVTVSTTVEATSVEDAFEKYDDTIEAAKGPAMEELLKQLKEAQQDARSKIVLPGEVPPQR